MKYLTNYVSWAEENSWYNYYKSSHQEKRAVFFIPQNNHNRATIMIWMCFTVRRISCFAAWLRGCAGLKAWSPTEGIKRLKAQEMDIYARAVSQRINRNQRILLRATIEKLAGIIHTTWAYIIAVAALPVVPSLFKPISWQQHFIAPVFPLGSRAHTNTCIALSPGNLCQEAHKSLS